MQAEVYDMCIQIYVCMYSDLCQCYGRLNPLKNTIQFFDFKVYNIKSNYNTQFV